MWSMKKSEKLPTGILQENEKIKELILENPELPLIFSEWDGDGIMAKIGEVLDCQQEINDEIVYLSRDDFESDVYNDIEILTGYDDRPEDWYEAEAERIVSAYERYWKPCIIIMIGNWKPCVSILVENQG